MRLPRDISGEDLAKRLSRYGYEVTRQAGSHLRMTTALKGDHHLTIPKHASLKVGTLNGILGDLAEHIQEPKEKLIRELFG
jgi:predicted RNA binding protein YcfA (HicA-like mRNA interferase family)